jgi:non-lysosomal glucosylceramidase
VRTIMKTTIGRRGFLKGVALAGGSASGSQAEQATPEATPRTEPSAVFRYPRTFEGRQLEMLAFPLGGVGAGSVCVGGRGQLRDWEIFNRPDHGRAPNYAFPSVWVQTGESKPVVRVLEARLSPPYASASGLSPSQVTGLSRLDGATFTGEYPVAKIAFRDRKLPVKVTLEAFTPFIPLDAEESGLPIAVMRYRISNRGKETARASIAFSLENPVGIDPRVRNAPSLAAARSSEFRSSDGLEGLYMTNPAAADGTPLAGSFALCVLGSGNGKVTYLRGWQRAKWWASPLLFWDDFSADGQLGPEAAERNAVGSLCLQREIPPGAEADYTFLLAWHFPNRTPAWCNWTAPEGEQNTVIGNHYCQRFHDAWDAAAYTAANLATLENRTRQFLGAMRATTLPAPVKEAAMANLSTLVTPTCFRTADGKFRGFEGINDDSGCCHGSCTHVWNYETSTQHIFPALARSMREAAFDLSDRLGGILPIRLALPEGKQTGGTTAADGTMGQIVKAYLDWRLSGDTEWLGRIWPKVKKTMEFAWIEGGWDGNRDGVLEGVQHNTYDVEFYGPNPMCGVHYLAALRACEEMARAAGDAPFSAECQRLWGMGSKWIDQNLFNGEYYVQKIQGIPADRIAKPLRSTGGAEDTEHPDFQVGNGCLADQLIGQYLADVSGLGALLDPVHIRTTLSSILRYNSRANLLDHDSVERTYALNDEAAVLVCDYGKGQRPKIPFPYSSEAWTGIEYLFASQLLYAGKVREGVACFENVRKRYDGERRNPWDEPECGHHYARAMSAWSGILALSGFRHHAAEKSVVAVPRIRLTSFSSFWSTGTGWGSFSQVSQNGQARFSLSVTFGKLPCRSVALAGLTSSQAKSSVTLRKTKLAHSLQKTADQCTILLAEPIELVEGDTLLLEV